VRRLLTRTATVICLVGVGLGIAYALAPGRGALELQVARSLPAQRSCWRACSSCRKPSDGKDVRARGRAEPATGAGTTHRPHGLVAIERLVILAEAAAFDLHYRLRPILREIAIQRLADSRGLRLDGGGPQVEQILGEGSGSSSAPIAPARRAASTRACGRRTSVARSSGWSPLGDDRGAGRTVRADLAEVSGRSSASARRSNSSCSGCSATGTS
jgi:hypothetical protein